MEEILKLFSVRDILLHCANTLILFVAIRFLVYKPVRKFMDARTARVQSALDEAAAARRQVEAIQLEAEEKRREAEEAVAKMQADAAKQANQATENTLKAAKAQADAFILKARAEAEAAKADMLRETQAQALDMAVEIAAKMIGRELSDADNTALAREFLTKVV